MSDQNNRNHKVGYKSPPLGTRFKKGASGNPSGRPKRRSSFGDTFVNTLLQSIPVSKQGRKANMPRLKALAYQMVSGAAKGDLVKIKLLLETLEHFGDQMEPVVELIISESESKV
jgi:hypothetical protein